MTKETKKERSMTAPQGGGEASEVETFSPESRVAAHWRSLVDGDDMPSENEWVLCAWDEGVATFFDPLDLAMGLHVDHEWRFIGPRPDSNPTHWMPVDRHIPNLDTATRATRDEATTGTPRPDEVAVTKPNPTTLSNSTEREER